MKKYKLENRKGLLTYSAFAKAAVLSVVLLISCNKKEYHLEKVAGSKTEIDSTLKSAPKIKEYIAPFKKSLDIQMNEPLSYNPVSMNKNDTKYNTAIGNMLAAIVREEAAPIYKGRTGNQVDMVLLNHGGIRAGMPAGPVTMRSAYEIMPFDNEIVAVELDETQMSALVNYLIEKKRAHPFDGIKIHIPKSGPPQVTMNHKETYHILTSDYLYTGGDNMSFFKDAPMFKTDYKIRNAMIAYFKKVDTLRFESDNRFDSAQ
jgi:2',3'-cyclic-nucleotide 2'-phosphodiesterase (5'-nucleotidase family)